MQEILCAHVQVVLGKFAGDIVAVKILYHEGEVERAACLKEVQILKACRSPYIVLLVGVVIPPPTEGLIPKDGVLDRPSLMIVMEYMIKRDLCHQLHEGQDPESFRWYRR